MKSAAALRAREYVSTADEEAFVRRYAPWIVAVVAALVYANSLRNGLVLDDEGIIMRNDVVHHVSGIWRAFVTPYWPNGSGQYRPLVISSFAAEWWLWGASPAGYHALNVAWHALASVLVYVLARRWLAPAIALVAGTLFAVHPVHTEAVANVVGRSELMAACGIIGTLLLHARRSRWAMATFAFALLSKEHALVTPVLALAMDTFSPPEQRVSARPSGLYAGYGVIAAMWGMAVFALFHDAQFANVDPFWTGMRAPARWMTMLGVVPAWIRLWFFPLDLSADYSPSVTLPWPEQMGLALVGAIFLASSVALAFHVRKRASVVTFAVVVLIVTMLPVANLIVPTGVIVAERTLYVSSIAVVLMGAAGLEWVARSRRSMAAAVLILLVIAGGIRTWTRNPVWESNRALLVSSAMQHPNGSWTHAQLGRVYATNSGFDKAVEEFRASLAIFDRNPVIWSEAISAAINARRFPLADTLVEQAERAVPGHYLVKVAHAHAAFESARFAEALAAARAAIAMAPDSAAPRFFAGLAWTGLRVPDSAIAAFELVPRGHPYRPMSDSVLKNLRSRE